MGGREKGETKFELLGENEVYPGNDDSDGGDRGDGNRSSSRRSLRPFLKAMVGASGQISDYCNSPRYQVRINITITL